ncbi:MAG: sugar nucleotidyltransferase [Candidatus Dormibacteria bacterium]
MKTLGIILSAGKSSRLYPATLSVTKQLLPIYDKPLVFFPLSLLMLARVRDMNLIVNPMEIKTFGRLIEQSRLDKACTFRIHPQMKPTGIPDAFKIIGTNIPADTLLHYDNVCLILGDNIFHGASMTGIIQDACKDTKNAHIFGAKVKDLHRFGVVSRLNDDHDSIVIEEKPTFIECPARSSAITGLYVFPTDVFTQVEGLKPSARGETEITDLIRIYERQHRLTIHDLPRGVTWFDTGTADALLDAAQYVRAVQVNQGLLVGSPHEVAYHQGWLDISDLDDYLKHDSKSDYAEKLMEMIDG